MASVVSVTASTALVPVDGAFVVTVVLTVVITCDTVVVSFLQKGHFRAVVVSAVAASVVCAGKVPSGTGKVIVCV